MKKVICYGAGYYGNYLFEKISEKYQILAYADTDKKKQGGQLNGVPIISPEDIKKYDYDIIVITSNMSMRSIKDKLIVLGIDEDIINTSYVSLSTEARIQYLCDLSKLHNARIPYDIEVAEAGVFQGEFSIEINKYYKGRKLHLFDTFDGFTREDIAAEKSTEQMGQVDFSMTSEEYVRNRMPYKEDVVMHKGYFPDTAKGIDSKFCFVNLDMDLYKPILEGLKFFSGGMVNGGVILVHDYFSERFPGVRDAVHDFMDSTDLNVRLVPVGDGISISVVGF